MPLRNQSLRRSLQAVLLACCSASAAFAIVMVTSPFPAFAEDGQTRLIMGATPLVIGIVLLFFALIIEWRSIVDTLSIERMSLKTIEKDHPRFIYPREALIAALLSATIGIFLTQLVFNMYVGRYIPQDPVLTDYTTYSDR